MSLSTWLDLCDLLLRAVARVHDLPSALDSQSRNHRLLWVRCVSSIHLLLLLLVVVVLVVGVVDN